MRQVIHEGVTNTTTIAAEIITTTTTTTTFFLDLSGVARVWH